MSGHHRYCKRLTNEQINTGDYTEGQLIENYTPLALAIANKIPIKYLEREEAQSIAILELTKIIKECEVFSVAQFTTLIKNRIRFKLIAYCRRYYAKSLISTKSRDEKPVRTFALRRSGFYRQYFEIDFWDTAYKVINNKVEEIIIKRILEGGYTQEEIAREAGLTRQRIGQIREELLERLLCELQK
jgi:RNA polymerase sigma factor (sigma-70 family)